MSYQGDGPVKEFTVGATAITEGMTVTVQAGVLEPTNATTEIPIGIAIMDAAAGAKCSVQLSGKYEEALADGSGTAIAVGDLLSPSATNGVLVKHAGTLNHTYAAKAIEALAANGRVAVLILAGIPEAA